MNKENETGGHRTENGIVRVDLGAASYDIAVGTGILPRIDSFLPFRLENRALFVLTDENVSAPHAETVRERLEKTGARSVQMCVLPPGEHMKSFAGLERVASWLLDHGVDRDSVLFAVGGGVVGDLGGFAAATIMRGISVVQVPTTLLSQADSAVGGKTAVNMPQGKNLVGVFHQPCAVICDTEALVTLPRRQILAGYAEIVKYALIDDLLFFVWLEQEGGAICALNNRHSLTKAIETSCRKKAAIVAADEKEKGRRALLNLGHTFGHALEAATGYEGSLLHGEAVAIGMVLAFTLSERLGLCPQEEVLRVKRHLSSTGLPTSVAAVASSMERADPLRLLSLMRQDKKADGGAAVYVLADGIGKARIVRGVSDADVMAVLERSFSEF